MQRSERRKRQLNIPWVLGGGVSLNTHDKLHGFGSLYRPAESRWSCCEIPAEKEGKMTHDGMMYCTVSIKTCIIGQRHFPLSVIAVITLD